MLISDWSGNKKKNLAGFHCFALQFLISIFNVLCPHLYDGASSSAYVSNGTKGSSPTLPIIMNTEELLKLFNHFIIRAGNIVFFSTLPFVPSQQWLV